MRYKGGWIKMTNISEMTDEQLNEACAIEVMEWHKIGCKFYDENNEFQFNDTECKTSWYERWNPTRDLNHAWMLAEKTLGDNWWKIEINAKHDGVAIVYGVIINGTALWKYSNLARAISEACLIAKRNK